MDAEVQGDITLTYKCCYLLFPNAIKNISSVSTLCRDSSIELLEKIALNKKKSDSIPNYKLSDFMPYYNEHLLVNRPALIEKRIKRLSFVEQKALRTINYISIKKIEDYFTGAFDYINESKKQIGVISNDLSGSKFMFDNGAGMYCLAGAEKEDINNITEFLTRLILETFSNNIDITWGPAPKYYCDAINKCSKRRITLSSLYTKISATSLNSLVNESSYYLCEHSFQKQMTCFISPGSCLRESGVLSYNSEITKYYLPKCVTIELQGANFL